MNEVEMRKTIRNLVEMARQRAFFSRGSKVIKVAKCKLGLEKVKKKKRE